MASSQLRLRCKLQLCLHILERNGCQMQLQETPSCLQVFSALFGGKDSVLVCAPAGSGKEVCAEFALLALINEVEAKTKEAQSDDSVIVPPLRAVYVASMPEIVAQTKAAWMARFGAEGLGLNVVQLTGEQQVICLHGFSCRCCKACDAVAQDSTCDQSCARWFRAAEAALGCLPASHHHSQWRPGAYRNTDRTRLPALFTAPHSVVRMQVDLKLLQKGNLVLATAEHWDRLSRRWRRQKAVSEISLFMVDELHLLGAEGGPTLEVVVSRMRAISKLLEKPIRVVALAASMADGKEVGEWLGAPSHAQFTFPPSVRPVPLEIHIQSMDIPSFEARMQVCSRSPRTCVPEQ